MLDNMTDLQEQLKQAEEERRKICRKYLTGRSGQHIDSWEETQFKVYNIDRYGFYHTEALPEDLNEQEKREIQIETQRSQKWLKMVKNWTKFKEKNREKLQKRIYKGVPNVLRREIWLKLLNIEQQMTSNPSVYNNMLQLGYKHSTEVRQIDNDINRCLRDHEHFRERYSTKQQQLFNVLVAYSIYNSELSYCQGISTVCAVLLIYLNEEEAFWALNTLMINRKFAMHGLYIVGFPKLMRFLAHHDRILTKFLPKVKKFLDKHNMDSVLYSLKWFFVIFVERLPFSLCLRIWDVYFMEGERVLSAMAYTILKLHATKLLKFKEMDAITDYFQYKLYKNFGYSDNFVIKSLELSLHELKSRKMELPPTPDDSIEYPKLELGKFVEQSIEKQLGLRTGEFSSTEKSATDLVIARSEENGNSLDVIDENQTDNISNLNTVTNLSDYEGDLSYMDDDIMEEDEVTYTNSNQNRKSLTCTSITSISEDRRSIATLNQKNFEEIVEDEDGEYHFKEFISTCCN